MATTSFRFETDDASPEPLSEIPCPGCRELLSVHMPDPELPERLLGTCENCKSWYVMDTGQGTMALIATGPAQPVRMKGKAGTKGRTQDPKRARIG